MVSRAFPFRLVAVTLNRDTVGIPDRPEYPARKSRKRKTSRPSQACCSARTGTCFWQELIRLPEATADPCFDRRPVLTESRQS